MRNEKVFLVKAIAKSMADADFVYFISFSGLPVKEFSDLRNLLAKENAFCRVLKNTLILKAAAELNLGDLSGVDLTGSTAMVCGQGDCSAVAKLLVDFGKKQDKVNTKGGFMDGSVLSAEQVTALANLPSKQVLQAMLLGVLQAPTRNLVTVLNAKAASILNVLNAYKDKKSNNN